jgi:hypothetical protein
VVDAVNLDFIKFQVWMNSKVNCVKNVEGKLQQKIIDLEAVRLALEEDVKDSEGQDRQRNEELLAATNELLGQLRLAQANIQALDET